MARKVIKESKGTISKEGFITEMEYARDEGLSIGWVNIDVADVYSQLAPDMTKKLEIDITNTMISLESGSSQVMIMLKDVKQFMFDTQSNGYTLLTKNGYINFTVA